MKRRVLTHGSLFAGIEGFGAGFEEAGWQTLWQSEKEPFCLAVLASRYPNALRNNDIRTCRGLTASLPASLARMSPWRVSEPDLRVSAQDCFMSLRESCESFDPLGLSSKMFPDFSVQTTAETLQKSSAFSWSSAGMGFHGACSTANFSESPNSGAVCSLLDALDDHVPQRFYLKRKALIGIVRRAAVRGRTLPTLLRMGLAAAIAMTQTEKPSPLSRMCAGTGRKSKTELASEDQGRVSPSTAPANMPSASSLALLETDVVSHQQLCRLLQLTPEELERAMQLRLCVRRLTPREKERLQGFPPNWTLPGQGHSETQLQKPSQIGSVAGS